MAGSLINTISGNAAKTPTVGMGATVLMYSDRYACTIVKVSKSGKSIMVQEDKATRVDDNGMSDSQTWQFESDPTAPLKEYTLRKNGSWVRKGDPLRNGQRIAIGYRDYYYDFSF